MSLEETLKLYAPMDLDGECIYFVQIVDDGPIKIGYSRKPLRRVRNLQASNPYTLFVVGLLIGNRDIEASLHQRFAEYWIGGDWFRAGARLLKYIDSLNFGRHEIGRTGRRLIYNSAWRGEDARLETKRSRIQRRLNTTTCVDCGGAGFDRRPINGDWNDVDPDHYIVLCRRCSMKRDGRLEKFIAVAKRPREIQPPKLCVNCNQYSKPLRKGLCHNCNEYFRRNGTHRTINKRKGVRV